MAKRKSRKVKRSRSRSSSARKSKSSSAHSTAVIGLIINVLFFPWLGTMIMKRKEWIAILILWVIGIATAIILIGFALLLIAWIWGLIIGVQEIQAAG